MLELPYKHYTRIQIRFADVDAMQHVNNSKYLSFLELARMHYFNEVLGDDVDWFKEGIILASATINFKTPILITDKVEVGMTVAKIGNKSFEVHYNIVKLEGDRKIIVADAVTVMVAFDYHAGKTIQVPQLWKNKFGDFEGREF